MNENLAANLFTVGELFDEVKTHYEIPIYQRNYAWGVEQIEQLIDDVWAAAQAEADHYFLGNLIVARKPPRPKRDGVTFEVVDGQQRLTTLLMLLAHLGVAPKAQITYQSRRNATQALTRLTTSDDDEGAGIHVGFQVIKSRMAKFRTSEERETFQRFLEDNVQLVRAILPVQTDLNKYFEIMNTRGQQLEQVDIIKARLMSYLRNEDDRACLGWVWDACAEMNSYIQMALTPSNTDLRDEIFSSTWDRLAVATFDDLILKRPQVHARSGVSQSTGVSMGEALRLYARTPAEPAEEDSGSRRFESPIKFPTLLLHALKVLRETDGEDDLDGHLDDGKLIKLFESDFKLLSEAQRSDRVKRFVEVLLRCKFVLDNYVLKREFTATNADDGAWSLKRLTRGESVSQRGKRTTVNARFPNAFSPDSAEWEDTPVDDATRDVLLLQSMFRVTYTSPRTMHWITRILGEPIIGLTQQDAAQSILDVLRTYARQKVQQAFFVGSQPTGFNIERVVFTYLDYLLATEGADTNFTFVYRNSVEHFFPQYANRDDDGWELVTPDDKELHMFGNLALVSVSTNSKFSNNLPPYKANKTEIVRQSTKLQLMSELVKSGTTWDKTAIGQHHLAMVKLLREDLRQAGHDVGICSTEVPDKPVSVG
ncbi:DUF262 domain-containing HNH endonuclease family protein [Arthrobacter sp. EH-1B-1]|uniref:DUF262 domain-containing HNH endonuclease family protein n=1 Tax=Arthrobacter vasquezii TaxID=2977629 RepID=A0ABT6CWL3_9MICC|nr:DUF262 domain-containing HNH endonuclease family protein [Arthrobacter vasquezii]MDF9278423.1 DUF262 domain-containing HNH endonuclease family protein [Arthrobacter vasquezii]